MNYRSAVVFGTGKLLHGEEKLAGLKAISDKIMPGRWDDARLPNKQEMKATAVVQVQMEIASAKIRSGGPIDDPVDQALDHWSGVVPVEWRLREPIADSLSKKIDLPAYLSHLKGC